MFFIVVACKSTVVKIKLCLLFIAVTNNNMLAYKAPVCQKTSEAPVITVIKLQ